jgi:hypothetical protein
MDLDTFANIAAALGTLIAGIALFMNLIQFRRLEYSIRGNTYQQLAQYALNVKEILLAHPDVEYLYAKPRSEGRAQAVFDRVIANFIEDVWVQKKYGLLDGEMWQAYDGLIREIIAAHPGVVKHMQQPSFVTGLRDYIRQVVRETPAPNR